MVFVELRCILHLQGPQCALCWRATALQDTAPPGIAAGHDGFRATAKAREAEAQGESLAAAPRREDLN